VPGSYSTALGVKEGATIARRNLEEILVYSVTQLAMWLSKPETDNGALGAPMDAEDSEGQTAMQGPGAGLGTSMAMDVSRHDSLGAKDSRRSVAGAAAAPRASVSVSLTARMRRGMAGEIVGDLHALLTRSKAVIAASNQVIGKPSADLTQILLNFLHERVGSS
jgi:nuclear pore complex protein Nup188